MDPSGTGLRTTLFTVLALVAFAANSVLCRLALGSPGIDAASFTTIRLLSGALTLLLFTALTRPGGGPGSSGSWRSALLLFLYAVTFSFAYLSLSAGTGALILFGAVQATMIVVALLTGERPGRGEWLGLLTALAGLVYLVSPGLEAPSLSASLLMAAAGISWGVYSLMGRGVTNPVRVTTGNFVRSVPLSVLVSVVALGRLEVSSSGLVLAVLSGSLASGLGYVVWYAALPGLSATRAATLQLSVPIVAAAGGIIFLTETITFRLVLSAAAVLGGVGLAVRSRMPAQHES